MCHYICVVMVHQRWVPSYSVPHNSPPCASISVLPGPHENTSHVCMSHSQKIELRIRWQCDARTASPWYAAVCLYLFAMAPSLVCHCICALSSGRVSLRLRYLATSCATALAGTLTSPACSIEVEIKDGTRPYYNIIRLEYFEGVCG